MWLTLFVHNLNVAVCGVDVFCDKDRIDEGRRVDETMRKEIIGTMEE